MNDDAITAKGVLTHNAVTKKTRKGRQYSAFTMQCGDGRRIQVRTSPIMPHDFRKEFFMKNREVKIAGFLHENRWLSDNGEERVRYFVFAFEVELIPAYV